MTYNSYYPFVIIEITLGSIMMNGLFFLELRYLDFNHYVIRGMIV
ncbi:MAG: hypothetical protein WDZ91_00405 [Paenibacillaceae bacterium]